MKNESLKKTITLDIDELNTIKVFGGGIIKTYGYVNDQFWTHGQDLIYIMKNFYKNLFKIINKTNKEHMPYNGGNIEHYFLCFLFENNIKIKQTNIRGRFIREFQK